MSSSSQTSGSARADILAGLRAAESSTVGDLSAEALLDTYRAEILREEATNLRRIERVEIPLNARGTRVGVLKAALILDERAADITGGAR